MTGTYHYALFQKETNKRVEMIHYLSPSYLIFNFLGDVQEPGSPGSFIWGDLNHFLAIDLDSGNKIEDVSELNLPFEISFKGKKIFDYKQVKSDNFIKEKVTDLLATIQIMGNNIMN